MLSEKERSFIAAYYREQLAGLRGPATAWFVSQGVTPDELGPLHLMFQHQYSADWKWDQGTVEEALEFPWRNGDDLRRRLKEFTDTTIAGEEAGEGLA